MKSNSVLIVGCGDLGARTGALLLPRGWQVAGVRRDISRLASGFSGYAADYSSPGSLDFIEGLQPGYIAATFNPTNRSVQGYQEGFLVAMCHFLLAGLGDHRPRHIIAVSSTRVYAEQQGGWVDERSTLSTDDPRAVAMIEAEQLLLAAGYPATVVRFAGIYGAPGGRLLSRISRGELCQPQPARYSNRIHRDDCAGFLAHLLLRADAGKALAPVYTGVDDQPVLRYEVESWLARELGVAVSSAGVAQSVDDIIEGKRCRNLRLHESGYKLLYEDYRSGYRAAIADSI